MKEDDLYQRPLEIWYFLYICVGVTSMALSRKNTHKGDISGISEKDDIHPGKFGISAEIPY